MIIVSKDQLEETKDCVLMGKIEEGEGVVELT